MDMFMKDMLSNTTLNGSNPFDVSQQVVPDGHRMAADGADQLMFTMNDTVNESSFGLIDDRQAMDSDMSLHSRVLADISSDINVTASLELRHDISQTHHLFGCHKQNQLFGGRRQVPQQQQQPTLDTNYMDNSLGLSPVKKQLVTNNTGHTFAINVSMDKFDDNVDVFGGSGDGIQLNSFGSNDMSFSSDAQMADEDFRSVSKCSDIELKADDTLPIPATIDTDETYRLPHSNFGDKSISEYFKQHSEPLASIHTFGQSFQMKSEDILAKKPTNELSLMNESFVSITSEMSSSNTTLENVQKLIDRKNRKRKSLSSNRSTLSDCHSFTPSVNSTLNLCDSVSDMPSKHIQNSKSVVTSGLGTLSTVQTFSPNSDNSQSISSLISANTLSLNQMLIISPNVLSLTIGCFVEFKLNYLKIKNQSITAFKAELKINANVDTLNALDIKYPKHMITIPAFFDGLFAEEITIIPLKCGSFTVVFQLYPSIENINLPISPLSIVCRIKSEEIVIKRPLFSSNYMQIHYNLFEDETTERQTIDLCVNNMNISDVIPLQLCLEANKGFIFEPLYRHPDSTIHTFRCKDRHTLFVATKTQYEIRIPLIIESNVGREVASCLTISTNSTSSHVLAIFQLKATFWPKSELTDQLLQCSQTSVCLTRGHWKTITFRNKSNKQLIRLQLDCIRDQIVTQNVIKFSSQQVMIKPLEKVSVALLVSKKFAFKSDQKYNICVKYDTGYGKSQPLLIPVQIN